MGKESSPTHDVFLSYSSHDKKWADAACAVLERRRIRCWIAPRDINPGDEWGAAIIGGIKGSRVMVLIFSRHANASHQVHREVERAISRGMAVLPVRVEDVLPEGAMEYALGNRHWLDAFTPPVERQMERLARSVEALLGSQEAGPADDPAPPEPSPVAPSGLSRPRSWRAGLVGLAALLLCFVLGLVVYAVGGKGGRQGGDDGRQDAGPHLPDVPRVRQDDAAAPEFLVSPASGIKLKRIPAGMFLMGSSKDVDPQAEDNELPRHEVRISRAFYLGVTEVTQGQYRAVTGESPSKFQGSDDLPVELVSWLDAVKFCNALSDKEGLAPFYRIKGDKVSVPDWKGSGYRLPTEAEWEYACRAGPGGAGTYSFGDDAAQLDRYAWYKGNSGGTTHPVGQKAPNAFGLFDMHGNVSEWCWDWNAPYDAKAAVDPVGPFEASFRVLRGGGWHVYPRYARSASRFWNTPVAWSIYLGFRVARVR